MRSAVSSRCVVHASYEEKDVYMDLTYYWHAYRGGGVIFGDDYRAEFYPGVVKAVEAFTSEHGLQHEVIDGQFWLLRKPID